MVTKKTKRQQQEHLPGLEPIRHIEIEEAAEAYIAARDQRMAMTKVEVEQRTILMQAMSVRDLREYKYDGYVVSRVAGVEKIKVNQIPTGGADAGERDEGEAPEGDDQF